MNRFTIVLLVPEKLAGENYGEETVLVYVSADDNVLAIKLARSAALNQWSARTDRTNSVRDDEFLVLSCFAGFHLDLRMCTTSGGEAHFVVRHGLAAPLAKLLINESSPFSVSPLPMNEYSISVDTEYFQLVTDGISNIIPCLIQGDVLVLM